METRAAATEATRQRLLDAALAVLGEAGAEGLTMQDVAARADVALRTLYNHFGSKEELLSEATTKSLDEVRAAVAEVAGGDGPPRDQLLDFVDVYHRVYERQNVAAAAMLQARGLPEVEGQVADIRAWRRSQIARMLRAVDAAEGLRIPLAQATALIFTLTSFATFSSLVDDGRLSPETARGLLRHNLETSVLT